VADWLSREEAKRLADRVLGYSRAEGCQVNLASGLSGNTRSAVDGVSTSGEVRDTTVTVASRFGKRSASVSTNLLDDAALRRAVETSEQLARLAPENPEQMPLLESQRYSEVPALAGATVELDAEARAEAVGVTHGACVRAGLRGAGFIHRSVGATAVANSAGLFAYHSASEVSHTLSVRTPAGDGAGWAGTAHSDWARSRAPAALAARAIARALQSRGARPLEPGKYPVILEPTAVANLLGLLAWSLDARAADEGRSFFSRRGGGNRIGEKVADDRVTILSDPGDPDLLQRPFTAEGEPIGRTVWIENGVVRNLAYDRYWAAKQGVASRPTGGGIRMSGSQATLEQLIAQVERGLLVTRFWYIRSVDPRTITYTGLTRDGVLLIENGMVTRAVQNFRFNESPIAMLRNLVALGTPERVTSSESGGLGDTAMVVPPIVTREFNFTSVSEAV
jgi:predicted Zn-dependent protease